MKNTFLHRRESKATDIPEQKGEESSYAEKIKRIAGLDALKNTKTIKALKFQVLFLILANLLIFIILLLVFLIL